MNADERLGFIFGRRSIRAYTAEPVSDQAVQRLLEAAMAAPSAAATDPWRFVVVKHRELLGRMAEALPFGKMLGSASNGVQIVNGGFEDYRGNQLKAFDLACHRQ